MKEENNRYDTIFFLVKVFVIGTLAILLSFFVNAGVQSSSYCSGFNAGYVDGFCYQDPNCLAPIPPICPLPTINEENTYEGGYQRGFVEGRNDKD